MLCLPGFAFLIVDLTFHGQRHLVRVRRQPLCRGSFVFFGSNRSLANHVDVVLKLYIFLDSYQRPWSKTIVSKDCAMHKNEAVNGIFFECDASHYAVVVSLVLVAAVVSQSHQCGKVPKLVSQVVSIIWPIILYIQGGCPALAALLQMYFKQRHETPRSDKQSVFYTRRCLILGWKSNFTQFRMIPPRFREIFR